MTDPFAHIEQYLAKELSPEDRQAFEARMQEDEALRKEVATYKEMVQALNNHFDREKKGETFQEKIAPLGEKYFSDQPEAVVRDLRRKPRKWLLMAVAAVFFLIAAISYFWDQNEKVDYIAAANKAISKHEKLNETMAAGGASSWKETTQWYNQGDYAKALPGLQAYLDKNSNDNDVQLAVGISLLHTKKYDSAMKKFKDLEAESYDHFRHRGEWYGTLALLLDGQEAAGIQRLERIAVGEGPFAEEAKGMLR